jgi:hypothetical protein
MQLATQDGASEENIVEVEYGQNFGSSCGSSNDQIRVTVSLDAGSNSGTEDVSGKSVFCSNRAHCSLCFAHLALHQACTFTKYTLS